MDTSTYTGAREILAKYGLTPSKRFGQNFLIDGHVLNKIVAAADLGRGDFVLEIGAGIGGLTRALAEKAGYVAAVELDKRLAEVLRDIFAETDNVGVIQGDIMKLDLSETLNQHITVGAASGRPLSDSYTRAKIVANLPYYITTPVIMRILESKPDSLGSALPIERATVMVQKEVAERIAAAPGTANYGAISAAVSYYAACELNAIVPRNCFYPRPDVDSAVITLKIYDTPPVRVSDERLMFDCVKAAFGQRRKTLVNCLYSQEWKGIGGGKLGKEEIAGIVKKCGFREDVRGETLGIEGFARLAEELTQYRS
ncbi:MAG: 16S rRNA (adenine(1518)-N(6)/adenine(1519)-N(6))-dimethyltransferase RsmA [Defluviitaleaceae bacterium]|nr:16S rRNA (adenine(1518)-N(6)/adenine(1519)-N(6))-dimethyltransferase RsmA [Defluviitaleaceae bacterium]